MNWLQNILMKWWLRKRPAARLKYELRMLPGDLIFEEDNPITLDQFREALDYFDRELKVRSSGTFGQPRSPADVDADSRSVARVIHGDEENTDEGTIY